MGASQIDQRRIIAIAFAIDGIAEVVCLIQWILPLPGDQAQILLFILHD
jgi:hypothetical protein